MSAKPLDQMTDRELNEVYAVEVQGYRKDDKNAGCWHLPKGRGARSAFPNTPPNFCKQLGHAAVIAEILATRGET